MPILSLDSSLSFDLKNDELFSCSKESAFLKCQQLSMPPLHQLRKRSSSQRASRSQANLTVVSSAFLSGLFADVAAAQNEPITKDNDTTFLPNKKSRLDLVANDTSVKLMKIASGCSSPKHANTTYFDIDDNVHAAPLNHIDSLHLQLDSVSSPLGSHTSLRQTNENYFSGEFMIFPQLPTMVSDTSCSSANRSVCDTTPPSCEKSNDKEGGYGWFVEMDDDDDVDRSRISCVNSHTSSLVFSAPIAPKATNCDAELEWAKAADTVDDVLGDFF